MILAILPCPFCGNIDLEMSMTGNQDREGYPVAVMCGECGCVGPWKYQTEALSLHAQTVEAWNQRKVP